MDRRRVSGLPVPRPRQHLSRKASAQASVASGTSEDDASSVAPGNQNHEAMIGRIDSVLLCGSSNGDGSTAVDAMAAEVMKRCSESLEEQLSERVRTEVALKMAHFQQALTVTGTPVAGSGAGAGKASPWGLDDCKLLVGMGERIERLEQQLADAGGAMDDIASMVQMISTRVSAIKAGEGGGGDEGGGGTVGESDKTSRLEVTHLTKLLVQVHTMARKAAASLMLEREKKDALIADLTKRLQGQENPNPNEIVATKSASPDIPEVF
ncbi:unnamed protein product [Discosporangium mesarthrocarpum]